MWPCYLTCYLLHGICVPPPPPPRFVDWCRETSTVVAEFVRTGKARNDLGIHPGNRAHRSCELTLNRRGGGGGGLITPRSLLRFFRNNSWTLADIDMKLGMALRTSILHYLVLNIRLVKKIAILWRHLPRLWCQKDKCLKIRQKYVCATNCKKLSPKMLFEQF